MLQNKFVNKIVQENINNILKHIDLLNINSVIIFDLFYKYCIKLPKIEICNEIFNNLIKYNILYK